VRLIGIEALSSSERLVMESAKTIREDFLQQNAYDEVDTYTSLRKQYLLLKLVMALHNESKAALEAGADIVEIANSPVRAKVAKAKFTREDRPDRFAALQQEVSQAMKKLTPKEETRLPGR
jgi:V/A-type H+-transporting ATPase subunit A